ncbi:MAG: phosphatidylserine decarboxylase [Myxococcota bacterium]
MAEEAQASPPVFQERLTSGIVGDALWLAAIPVGLGVGCALLGWGAPAVLCLLLAGFVFFFFRNPDRSIPPGEDQVVAPADGRVIDVGTVEQGDGGKALRIGIFLSVFDVHVNRAPVSGRVVALERGGSAFRAAFDRRAEQDNVRCALTLETGSGRCVQVVQITGLIARRIVCQPRVGEWLPRGARFGLIRFGSRTDVLLPPDAEACVKRGDRVRGGSSVVAVLPGGSA